MPTLTPLTADELEAFGRYAEAEQNRPLEALVAELRARRAGAAGHPWAILIVLSEAAAALVPAVLAAGGAPVLVLAPDGVTLRHLRLAASRRPCLLASYDPSQPLALRQFLQDHGIDLQ